MVYVEPLERRRLLSNSPHLKQFDHVVVVIEENHDLGEILDDTANVPYINSLAAGGAVFTNAHAIGDASQPNYLALFSGSTHGVTGDGLHPKFPGPDLFSDLAALKKTFVGYSQSMPAEGFEGAVFGLYA